MKKVKFKAFMKPGAHTQFHPEHFDLKISNCRRKLCEKLKKIPVITRTKRLTKITKTRIKLQFEVIIEKSLLYSPKKAIGKCSRKKTLPSAPCLF